MNDSDAKNGKLVPFVLPVSRPDVQKRNVLALVYAFDAFAKARAERIAATPVTLKPKPDRRQRK
jgi:hypothetical protein